MQSEKKCFQDLFFFFFFGEDENIKLVWMHKREDSILSFTNYQKLFMTVWVLKCIEAKRKDIIKHLKLISQRSLANTLMKKLPSRFMGGENVSALYRVEYYSLLLTLFPLLNVTVPVHPQCPTQGWVTHFHAGCCGVTGTVHLLLFLLMSVQVVSSCYEAGA